MSSFVSDKTNTFTGITYNDDEYGAFANNLPDYDQTTLATTTLPDILISPRGIVPDNNINLLQDSKK